MSWNAEKSVEEVREEFLERWSDGNVTVLALCREYGISPKTAYKWRNRKASGDSLSDRCRRPKSSPNATPEPVVLEILALRKAHPTLGGKKISLMLKRKGVEGVPSGVTVTSILRRHDLLNERAAGATCPKSSNLCLLSSVFCHLSFVLFAFATGRLGDWEFRRNYKKPPNLQASETPCSESN